MSVAKKAMVGVAAAALVGSAGAPASAEKQTFDDKRGDVHHGFDIQTVHVRNNGAKVKVWVNLRNLSDGDPGALGVFIDTRRRDRGPEFLFSTPVGVDASHGIWRMERWRGGHGLPKRCRGDRHYVNYKHDRVRISIPRRCLGRHTRAVRVAVRAIPVRGRNDWAPRFHRFYPSVSYR